MRQEITEDEIEKILERLAYGNQTDLLAQKLYFNETEAIQQNRIKDNRVIDALKIITSNAPSSSARKEASKTLDYLETGRWPHASGPAGRDRTLNNVFRYLYLARFGDQLLWVRDGTQ